MNQPDPESKQPVIPLCCCCCGNYTLGRQWHNRDTGYGLCVDCVEYCSRGENEASMHSLYGVRGVHYDITIPPKP